LPAGAAIGNAFCCAFAAPVMALSAADTNKVLNVYLTPYLPFMK
jgi:hypothetical protein